MCTHFPILYLNRRTAVSVNLAVSQRARAFNILPNTCIYVSLYTISIDISVHLSISNYICLSLYSICTCVHMHIRISEHYPSIYPSKYICPYPYLYLSIYLIYLYLYVYILSVRIFLCYTWTSDPPSSLVSL